MDITLQSAGQQAAAVAAGKISATELLEVTIERYERLQPCDQCRRRDTTRRRAVLAPPRPIGRPRAGESWGVLHGVPMTIKEAWDWVGSASTSGYPERLDWRPERNSEAVQRLLDAGAVIYGKTNLPVGMADWQTFNPVYGTTGNPWNPDLIPGGSSGGAAAALAAGLTALELGSDIGASIRNPAHYCGVFGHKPTYGLVPDTGHGNPGSPVSLDIGVGGPMARYASDLALGLDIVAGAGGMNARGWKLELPAPRRHTTRRTPGRGDARPPERAEVDARTGRPAHGHRRGARRARRRARLGGTARDRHRQDARRVPDAAQGGDGHRVLRRSVRVARRRRRRFDDGDRDYRARSPLGPHGSAIGSGPRTTTNASGPGSRGTRSSRSTTRCSARRRRSVAYPHDQVGRARRPDDHRERPAAADDRPALLGRAVVRGVAARDGGTRRGDCAGLPCGLQIVTGHLRDREGIAFAEMMERELGGYVIPPGYD